MLEEPTQRPPGRGFAVDARARSHGTAPDKAESAIRELDHRYSDRIDVRLLWDPQTDRVFVAVEDERSEETFSFEVDAAHALDGFRHPYAYASQDHNDASDNGDGVALGPGQRAREADERQR